MAGVRVHFVTNRNLEAAGGGRVFGSRFNPDGVAALRFGYVDFAEAETAFKPANVHVYPEGRRDPDAQTDPDITKTGGGRFLEALRGLMNAEPRNDTLVFIHGFNVGFPEAIEAGAKLAREIRIDAAAGAPGERLNVVVFSWPSDGEKVPFMSYYSDREDARASGPALARAFLKLTEFLRQLDRDAYCLRSVHLMAHSMGAYVLRQGLQAVIAKQPDGLVRVFDQILLCSPDEDDDTFEHDTKLKLLPRLAKRVTVYFNPQDKALWISDKTKANPDRLGADGARLVDLLPKKVAMVDCRRVAGVADPKIEHSYYVSSLAMTDDIAKVLAGLDADEMPNRVYAPDRRVWRIQRELV